MKSPSETDEKPVVGIYHSSYYLAPRVMSIDEVAVMMNLSENVKIYKHGRGLEFVHVTDGETTTDMAVKAARKVLAESETAPEEIDAVVFCHSFYNTTLDPVSSVGEVQYALGLTKSIGFSISHQYCASIVMAIRAARNMILAGSAKMVMVVCADCLQESKAREIRQIGIMSDGAGAIILKKGCERNRLLAIMNHVQGSFYNYPSWQREDYERYDLAYFLATTRTIIRTLSSAGLTIEDLNLLIPHNTNMSSWLRVLAMLKLNKQRFFSDNIRRHSHACGADIIINLSDAIEVGRLRTGDYALLVTAGLGACWGCVLIQH
jgi:3-oxoacyl-[acyl-carrier-protein] synthase III